MQPQQLPPTKPYQNPYDAILNHPTPPKKSRLPGLGGNSLLVKIVFVGIVLVFFGGAFGVYSSLTAVKYDTEIELLQRQHELVRTADLALSDISDGATRAYVSTVRNVTASEETDTAAFLKKKKQKISAQELAARKDTDTDKALTTAKQNNTLDAVIVAKINQQIAAYQSFQKEATASPRTSSEKALFSTLRANATVLAVQ